MARAQLQFWTKKRPGVANKKKVMVSKKMVYCCFMFH